jgi:hypothetical protein
MQKRKNAFSQKTYGQEWSRNGQDMYRSTSAILAVLTRITCGDHHSSANHVYYKLHTTLQGHMYSSTELKSEIVDLSAKIVVVPKYSCH